ncbi:MAG: GNAT family N-acetyltransferase [Promethearchaeota archaeon]|nr:MAG: GNAT family N-acetyltransferase [Candidatus Lokiarchaeota archaeon]
MSNILKEIIPESINYHIEKNLDDFYIKSSEHPNFASSKEKKISWVLSKNADWPHAIFRADFEDLNLKKEINNIKKLIRKGKAPNGWTVGPLTRPKDLGIHLERYNFSNVYHQAGMAIELQGVVKTNVDANNLIIERIDNEKNLNQWSEVVSKVFQIKIDFDLLLRYLYSQEEAYFYLGKFEGIPVSTLMLYLSSGVAGLHAVSTLNEYRNKGFGLAISKKALEDAFNKGYLVGVLQASSLGERVYKKLGFQKYCDIISYEIIEDK